ncbi:MAG: hypothetical protein H0V33_08745, partial [Acidimicrobiia bacterium]|nr:hypothetical protein [Acidimicrobiia bacterium]
MLDHLYLAEADPQVEHQVRRAFGIGAEALAVVDVDAAKIEVAAVVATIDGDGTERRMGD